ncbi:type II toxin-antitoxin system HicB family antitoxin [Azohydromonas australica]|uniref:type II toxin-antitoxin system HicB family antitoxin n=1 Tax=Azohydromonas australica TaxID=364039 RepID=UPI00041DCE71|nr:type II toxin-antitoxin system HicB family antitoxin [Azohydromonas australica]
MSDVKHIQSVHPPYPFEDHARLVSHLSEENDGDYLVTFQELPGVMADGGSTKEALRSARDVFESAIAAMVDMGRDIPAPTIQSDDVAALGLSGKFVTRVPKKGAHAQLARCARAEGVSLNSLVLALLAEGLGRRSGRA